MIIVLELTEIESESYQIRIMSRRMEKQARTECSRLDAPGNALERVRNWGDAHKLD